MTATERIWVAGDPQEYGCYYPSCVEAEGNHGGVGIEYGPAALRYTAERKLAKAVEALRDALDRHQVTHIHANIRAVLDEIEKGAS